MVTPDPVAGTEFWRDIKPIDKEKVFRKDAAPEVFLPDTMTDDDRFFVPLSETVFTRPLWISLAQNRWADVLMAKQPGLVNRHYHPHQVFGYTLSGQWSYLEHDWVATAGTFVYEAPGEAHTLVAHESPEPMRVHFNVTGPLIWLDENGEPNGTFDAYDYLELARDHYDKAGLGAEAVHKLLR
jgi:2,4'-dihydroxyacetophenone dioxygenase